MEQSGSSSTGVLRRRRLPPLFDLDCPGQIAEMVHRLCAELSGDDLLGPVFERAGVDWSHLAPTLTTYWCGQLLALPGYDGNPYRAHERLDERSSLSVEMFERWIQRFDDVIDEGWIGPHARAAKAIARHVAQLHCAGVVGEPLG